MRPFIFTILLVINYSAIAQTINESVPAFIEKDGKYLFYLHGGIVGAQGPNAVSPYYGPYKYQAILDSLAARAFHVISKVRPVDTNEEAYARKMARQIDILHSQGISYDNIFVVGASLGAYITIELAYIMKEEEMNFTLLGLCSDYAVDYYQKYNQQLKGNFLSIFESKDEKHSCEGIFKNQTLSSYQEIRLTMGNGHAFLYQPYTEWIEPLVKWMTK